MKVPSASPAWAWGNWYQSDSYRIGEHDLADLDFATGLLQTQPRVPVMQSEFQAGWLQGADEGAPRPSDPSNTTLALARAAARRRARRREFSGAGHGLSARLGSAVGELVVRVGCGADGRSARVTALRSDARFRRHWFARTARCWHDAHRRGCLDRLAAEPLRARNAEQRRFRRARRRDGRDAARVQRARVELHARRSRQSERRVAARDDAASSARTVDGAGRAPRSHGRRCTAARAAIRRGSVVGALARALQASANVTLLLADDATYGFIVAINPSDNRRRVAVARALGTEAWPSRRSTCRPRSALVPVGTSPRLRVAGQPAPPAERRRRFGSRRRRRCERAAARCFRAVCRRARRRTQRRQRQCRNQHRSACATRAILRHRRRRAITSPLTPIRCPPARSIGLMSAQRADVLTTARITCAYDAPDLPSGRCVQANADAERRRRRADVVEQLSPHDPRSTARLESISGFAFAPGDAVISRRRERVGMLHGQRLASLRWRAGDVAHVELRTTRGAELVTVVSARRSARAALRGFAGAKRRRGATADRRETAVAHRGSGGMADAAASKAAEATHVGSTPTFPITPIVRVRGIL